MKIGFKKHTLKTYHFISEANPDPAKNVNSGLFFSVLIFSVLMIRIFYYADPDTGSGYGIQIRSISES